MLHDTQTNAIETNMQFYIRGKTHAEDVIKEPKYMTATHF
jgi:hypothetical protein